MCKQEVVIKSGEQIHTGSVDLKKGEGGQVADVFKDFGLAGYTNQEQYQTHVVKGGRIDDLEEIRRRIALFGDGIIEGP